MSKSSLLGAALLSAVLLGSMPVQAAKPQTAAEKFSYAVGMQVAQGLQRDGVDVEIEPLVAAIRDVLSGQEPQLSREEIQAVFMAYQQEQQQARDELAAENLKKGQDFLAANGSKEGIKTLDNGIQYRVLTAGTGKQPTPSDTVEVHYRGTLIDGTEFDSSYSRGQPATFPVEAVIQGWQQVLPMMKEGAKWQVFIPADLAYGEHGAGGAIGPNETLIFDIELLAVK